MAKNPWSLFDAKNRPLMYGLSGRTDQFDPGLLNAVDDEAVAAMNQEPTGTPIQAPQAPAPTPTPTPTPMMTPESLPEPVAAASQGVPDRNKLAFEGMDFDGVPHAGMSINARRYFNDIDPRLINVTGTKPGEKIVQKDQRQEQRGDLSKVMIDPSEIQSALSLARDTPEYQEQKDANDNLDRLSAQMVGKADPNAAWLKPLIALTDSVSGSNLMKGYDPGMSQKDRNALIMKYADESAKRKKDLYDQSRKFATGVLGDTVTNKVLQNAALMTSIGDHMRTVPEASRIHWLATAVDRDMKELKNSNASMQEAQRLLASSQSVADTTFRDKFLKAMIGGRVTNYDLMRQTGDSSLAEKASQLWNSMTEGTFSPKNRAEYQDAIRIIAEANQHEAALRLARAKNIGMSSYGLEEAKVNPITEMSGFGIGAVPPPTLQKSAHKSQQKLNPKPAEKPFEEMSNDELKAYIKKNGGHQ